MLYLRILAPAAPVVFAALPPGDGVAGGGVEGGCAFAVFTGYRATVANAAYNNTAVITIIFVCSLKNTYNKIPFIRFLIRSSLDSMETYLGLSTSPPLKQLNT
jgi:hypothetical protein